MVVELGKMTQEGDQDHEHNHERGHMKREIGRADESVNMGDRAVAAISVKMCCRMSCAYALRDSPIAMFESSESQTALRHPGKGRAV